MESVLSFAQGPLFGVALLVMVLGLARHVLIQLAALARSWQDVRGARWQAILRDAAGWAVPVGHLARGTVVITVISFVFHVGVVLVPLFLADHIALWERFLGVGLPQLPPAAAEWLSLVTIACGLALLLVRVAMTRVRDLSRSSDYLVLVLVLLPMVSGYLAAHPAANPLPWTAMMLIHALSADLLLVAIPFTKLAHVVLFPFERLSQVHWRLQPGAGEKVAQAVWGQEVRV